MKKRERLDVSIEADQLVSAYIMDGENFDKYLYCELSYDCPMPYPLVWFEFDKHDTLQATQTRWQASTATETGFHLLVVGPDFSDAHVNITTVEFHW
jgi:hypothetical protein